MTRTWRPSVLTRIISGCLAIGLTAVAVGIELWEQSNGHLTVVELIRDVLICCFLGLSVISVLRTSVTLTDNEVIIQNLFRSHRVRLADARIARFSDSGLTISLKGGGKVPRSDAGLGETYFARMIERPVWGDLAAEAINAAISRHKVPA